MTISTSERKLLENLCNACAVSGDEGEVRAIVLEELKGQPVEVKVDALGNVLATRNSSSERNSSSDRLGSSPEKRLRVMLAAHMDEVGFMLTNDEGEGIFRFDTVGNVDERQLVGKPVWVGRDHVAGVIGAKAIHLTTPAERKNAMALDTLRIDLGLANEYIRDSNSKVKIGDRATFATPFTQTGPSLRGKALDDRLGVATLIELVKNPPPQIDLLAAFTVQEEIGLRGARVAAYTFDPDIAIVLDCSPAFDLPTWDGAENAVYNTRLGAGPAIYVADSGTLSDPRLVRHFIETAEASNIPYQLRQPGGGGTDAGAIHKTRAGIPSISVSIPGRYLHTAINLARLSDWQNTLTLLHLALERLTPAVLTGER